VDIKPEDGYSFDCYPTLDVSGNTVNLHPNVIKSFNVDKDISYYEVYDGNLITLHPGQYVLKVEADGFIAQNKTIYVAKGEHQNHEFTLTPVTGTLSLSDEEYAEGAVAFLDGVRIGTVPVDGLKVKSGSHVLSFAKDGFMTLKPEYTVTVPENREVCFKVTMQRYSAYTVSSDPAYCKVYLDGIYQGATPVQLILNEGEHTVRYEKNGYYPLEKKMKADFSQVEHTESISLVEAYPLLITADKDSLGITISQGSGKNRVVYAENVKTPATVEIPLSKKPYQLELTRNNLKRAWKGNLSFDKPEKNHKNVLIWGVGAPAFAADWYALPPKVMLESSVGKNYTRLADAQLGIIHMFPGLSTSALKGTMFWETDASQHINYGDPAPAEADYKDVKFLPAISGLLINEEFRIGGAILQNLDVNLLLTYTWYPKLQILYNLTPTFAFSHISGHDVFGGIEFNSRIPVFNVHVKAGMQAFFGQANIVRPGRVSPDTAENKYLTVPYKSLPFVVSIGFTLGGNQARGQNILRVF
jgi:hypothetical protein